MASVLVSCIDQGAPTRVTVTEAEEPPHWMYTLDAASHHPILEESVHRRQDAPEVYVLNGAVYVARTRWMRETQSFLHDQTVASPMPRERAMDVDDELDAHVAEVLLASRHN